MNDSSAQGPMFKVADPGSCSTRRFDAYFFKPKAA